MDLETYRQHMVEDGFALFPGKVSAELLGRLRQDIPRHCERCLEIGRRNGVGEGMGLVAHHVVGAGDSLDEFAAQLFLDAQIRDYFSGEYILNSFGALDNIERGDARYEHGHTFHRDVRTYSENLRLMLNMLVMVDEFTEENGATRLVPGSHRTKERPTDAFLAENSISATGPAGTILLFDSNVWHSASRNRTNRSRRALTLTFTRPFVKQQLDYPRLLGEDFTADPRLRQVLGYNSRVPADHDQWYQPAEKRMYQPGQG